MRVLREISLDSFTVSELRYSPNERHPPHDHAAACVAVVVAGGVEEVVGQRTEFGAVGSISVKPAGSVHSNRFAPHGTRVLMLRSGCESGWSRTLTDWKWLHGRPAGRLALGLLRAFRGRSVSPVALEERGFEVLAAVGMSPEPADRIAPPPWLRGVRDYLHAFAHARVSLRDAAAVAGVHPCHLGRVFRRHTGCSVGEYLRRLRLQYASQLLADGDMPLAQIAHSAGYADQPHLQRRFRRALGVSPTDYRQLHRAGPD